MNQARQIKNVIGTVDLSGIATLTFARLSAANPIQYLADLPDYVEHLVDAHTGEIFPVLVYGDVGEVPSEKFDLSVVIDNAMDKIINTIGDGREIMFDPARLMNAQRVVPSLATGRNSAGYNTAPAMHPSAPSNFIPAAEKRLMWTTVLRTNIAELVGYKLNKTTPTGIATGRFKPSMSVSLRDGEIGSIDLHTAEGHLAFYRIGDLSEEAIHEERAMAAQRAGQEYGNFSHIFQQNGKTYRFCVNNRGPHVVNLIPVEYLDQEARRIYADAIATAKDTINGTRNNA